MATVAVTGFIDERAYTEYLIETRASPDAPPRKFSHRFSEFLRLHQDLGLTAQFPCAKRWFHPKSVKEERARRLVPEVEEIYARYPDDPGRAREERIALYAAHDPGPTPASVVIDHIVHALELVGDDHVGLGADWDGVPTLPVGLEDCSKLEYVTVELLRRGYSEETVRKVLGENLLRVMEAVEETSRTLASEGS